MLLYYVHVICWNPLAELLLTLSGEAFSVVRLAQWTGGGLTGPDARNQNDHQLIEMKFCVNHYSHKSMSDVKFKSGGFSTFGNMASKNFPQNKGTSPSNSDIYPRKMGLTYKKVLPDPKLTPMLISAVFKHGNCLFILKPFRHFDGK